MDTVLFGDAATFDRATMVERVVTYAQRHYRGEAEENELARWAEEAVAHVWGDGVLVTNFVPMLALREVRERVLASRVTSLTTRLGDERTAVPGGDQPPATPLSPDRRIQPAPAVHSGEGRSALPSASSRSS